MANLYQSAGKKSALKLACSIAIIALVAACSPLLHVGSQTEITPENTNAPNNAGASNIGARKSAIISYLHQLSANHQLIAGTQVNEYENFQDCTSMDMLATRTGKEPALMGMELMFAGFYNGYEDRLVERATNYARQGGMVTFAWHQRNPLAYCVRGEFYDCTKIPITDAQMEAMLTAGTPENRLFKADVALLARTLQRLKNNNVPVMFRPLHEMTGPWFWWGRKDAYPRLWDALYDELVSVHGLENLIWVWSGAGAADDAARFWPVRHQPDIIGTDVYNPSGDGAEYYSGARNVRAASIGQPFGFTEVGKAPSEAVLAATNPAFVLLWGGEFLDNRMPANWDCASCNSPSEITSFFARPNMITLDEVPMSVRTAIAGGRPAPIAARPSCPA